jgi:hypothetical protein
MRPHVGGLIARASLPAALHQAAGGWRPAPLHSWPKGRRPFRESPRRHPDPWWPLQTSKRLRLAPLDIFYPAQSGSPLLHVTISRSRCDYALRWNPFRGNCTKVNLRRGLCPRGHAAACGVSLHETSVLAEKLVGFLVDQMKPGAGEADDGRIGIGIGLVRRGGVRKPMLHVRAQPRAFEKDVAAHSREYAKPVRPVTSVCLRSWGLGGPKRTRLLRLGTPNRPPSLGGPCFGFLQFSGVRGRRMFGGLSVPPAN